MTLQEFIEKWNGKYLEVAGSSAQNQCVDNANGYIRDVLNLPIIEWTNAIDFPSKGGDDYEYILNTPTGVPLEGDLIIWGGNKYGHIAVFIEGNANSFRSFDQNYPTGSPCHVQNHTYANVTGWMRAKKKVDTQTIIDELRQARDENWNKYQEEVIKNNELQNQLNSEIQKCQDLRDVLDKQTKADADLGTQLLDAQHKANELQKELEQVKAEKTAPVEPVIEHYESIIEKLWPNLYKSKKARSLVDRIWRWIS